jgi:predicted DsbA family dithiol-disulfide isomerase
MTSKIQLEISIIGDFTCPWCYIAKHNINRAIPMVLDELKGIAEMQGVVVEFKICLQPFLLRQRDPEQDIQPIEPKTAFPGKHPLHYDKSYDQLFPIGEKIGIAFHKRSFMQGSLRAHRLVQFILKNHGEKAHTKTVDLIYKGYHERDADINDPIFLASCAVGIMTLQEVKEFVESNEFLDEVLKKSQDMKDSGIKMVPVNRIGGHQIQGSQTASAYKAAILKSLEDLK